VDNVDLGGIPRVRIDPPLAHDRLGVAAARGDALLLPFRVDELTRAVDPVKLYEYIALGKPILSAHWDGLERFAPFVTFYRDVAGLARMVRMRAIATVPEAGLR
jgi:hypothetical protein